MAFLLLARSSTPWANSSRDTRNGRMFIPNAVNNTFSKNINLNNVLAIPHLYCSVSTLAESAEVDSCVATIIPAIREAYTSGSHSQTRYAPHVLFSIFHLSGTHFPSRPTRRRGIYFTAATPLHPSWRALHVIDITQFLCITSQHFEYWDVVRARWVPLEILNGLHTHDTLFWRSRCFFRRNFVS